MTEYKRQGAIVRTSDGKQQGVVSDDDTQLLVRDLETDELRWVTISDVEFVTAASAMTRWEPDGDWKIHHDIFVRDARSFPTTDGDTLTPGDPVRSEGRHQILGTGAGVVDGFSSRGGSIWVGVKNAGVPNGHTSIPLAEARRER